MKKIILVGDLIDKGPASKEVVAFVLKNIQHFIVVKGNHENFVIKFLKGEIKRDRNNESLIDTYFDSIKAFQEDEHAREQLFELEKHMVPCVVHSHFVVTHAPCEERYIGKLNPIAQKKQLTFVYAKAKDFPTTKAHTEKLEEEFGFIPKQSRKNNKQHVFGHVSFGDMFKMKSTYGIDTGCVSGNKLTAVVHSKDLDNFQPRTVRSKQPKTKENYPKIFQKKDEINIT